MVSKSNWKNKFPLDSQEVIQFDLLTNEKHIADVKTSHNLVIEFQHSVISIEELSAREKFYGDMIWIVDGLRNDMDGRQFQFGTANVPIQKNPLLYSVSWYS